MEPENIELLFPDPQKLRAARESAGVSQAEMGRRLHVGRSQVNNIESGRTGIQSHDLMTWAQVCRVGVSNLHELYSPADEVKRVVKAVKTPAPVV